MKYKVTKKEFEKLEWLCEATGKQMEVLKMMCTEEKSDINYGFTIGEVYNFLDHRAVVTKFMLDKIKQKKHANK